MASNMPEDFDEQFLTCPVCMLHFRDPRVLPCLHTFCRGCLEEWATKQQPLECPTCRTQVSLPDQGVDGLRTNFYVNNLLDFAAAKKGAEPGVPCQVCEGNVEGSKSWCADCAILMCESCTLLHSKFPTQKNHEVTSEATIKAEKDAGNFQRKRHCHKHQAQELVFYCETCNALVCTACTVVDHRPGRDHNPVEIATVAQQRKEELQGLLRDIDPRLREIEASVKEVEKEISKLMPSKEASTNRAKAYFRRLVDLLQKREEEILSRVDEQCRLDGKALQTKKEAIEFELAGLTSAQTFCQQAVEHGSDVHVLEVGNQVKTRVETLLAKQLGIVSDWNEFEFVEKTVVADFEKQVHDFGDVKTKVDVSKCTVVVKPAVQGCVCVAELTTINKEGRPYVTDSEAVTTNMKDPSGKNVLTTQLQSGGRWEIFYVPQVTGNHRLEVKVNSQQVAGSPFDVIIIGQKTDDGVGKRNRPVRVAKPGVGKTSKSGFSFVRTGQSGYGFGASQQTAEATKLKTGFSFGFALPQTSTTSQTTALTTGFQFKPPQPETSDSAQSGGFSFKLDQSQPSQSCVGLKSGQSQSTTPSQSGFKFGVDQSQSSKGSQPATSTEGSKFTFGDVKDKATAEGDLDDIFMYEKKPTTDQIERAKKFLLPPTFYLYEDKPLPEGWTEEDKLDDKPERRVVKGGETPGNASEAVGSKTSQSTDAFGTASSNLVFADLIGAKTQDFAWGKSDKPFGGFQGAGTQLFGTLNTSQESDGAEPNIEEERDDIYFEPIIPLPDKMELVTGEEDERVLYEQRAKLFRWDKGTNQWKERGIGNIKFLLHKTTKRIRIIMRRDQVLKVCANHLITTDMTLKPNAGSWVWHAMDCSDEEPAFEQFAVRFKSTEIAEEFHKRFEQCQAMLIDVMPPSPSKNAGPSRESQLINSAKKLKSELKSLKEQFAVAAPGMQSPRESEEQYIDRLEWVNYDIRKDSSHDTSNQSFFGSTSQPSSFSFSASFADSRNLSLNLNKIEPEEDEYYQDDEEDNIHFSPIATLPENVAMEHVTAETTKPKTGCALPQTPLLRSLIMSTPTNTKPAAAMASEDGQKGLPNQTMRTSDSISLTRAFTEPSQPLSLTIATKYPILTTMLTYSDWPRVFQASRRNRVSNNFASIGEGDPASDLSKSLSKNLFVTGEERMFQRPEEVERENQELASDDEVPDETEVHDDGIHFEPIVTLPDTVELKTGEEDEDEVFVHRAKLFRFDKDNHQWKERGLGNIKVLKNRHNQRFRILMRRDQVLKICCNHYITADMSMKPNAGSNRTWVWVAMDFAEEGGRKEQFAVRFKEAETALEFKNRVDEAIRIITSLPVT
ncbi:E3 SUMO-protein ligase RanBP2-like [Branchiostoma lanceolatum]|uniref:E3 SUMO-protein ligase RanBP2-like n=1 Tax=Branchiostoma lanceolatum TaxID=7740 RepID=UPI00345145A6